MAAVSSQVRPGRNSPGLGLEGVVEDKKRLGVGRIALYRAPEETFGLLRLAHLHRGLAAPGEGGCVVRVRDKNGVERPRCFINMPQEELTTCRSNLYVGAIQPCGS